MAALKCLSCTSMSCFPTSQRTESEGEREVIFLYFIVDLWFLKMAAN